ncbi:hypothetical protein P692DRAFT_20819615 [Suillus brevipes Sb2]|nr:hypothetical protein P692DRAFT_20819615 [Suillus brevipes Sb2]
MKNNKLDYAPEAQTPSPPPSELTPSQRTPDLLAVPTGVPGRLILEGLPKLPTLARARAVFIDSPSSLRKASAWASSSKPDHPSCVPRRSEKLSKEREEGGKNLWYAHAESGDNKRDPHEEIEASRDIVKDLLPVLGRGWADDILAVQVGPSESLNCRLFEANSRMVRVTSVHLICADKMNVDASYEADVDEENRSYNAGVALNKLSVTSLRPAK